MTKRVLYGLLLISILSGCSGPAQQNYIPTKSSLELQSMQTKYFNTKFKIAFKSVVSVLQDAGYIINNADIDTGLISASSPRVAKRSMGSIVVEYRKSTAFIEVMPNNRILVRLNFVNYNDIRLVGSNSVPIEDVKFYQNIFSKIDKAIFIRTNTK